MKNYIKAYWQMVKPGKLLGLLGYMLLLQWQIGQAQPRTSETTQDSIKITQLNQQFALAIQKKQYEQAASYGEAALKSAEKNLYVQGKIKTLLLFGKLYTYTHKISEALMHYLQAESLCQNFNAQILLVNVYDHLGYFYQQQHLHQKAVQYFRQAYKIRQKKRFQQQLATNVKNIASSYFILEDYTQAYVFNEKLLGIYRKVRNKKEELRVLEQLALITSFTGSYNKAIGYNLTLLKHYQKTNNLLKVSGIYNDLGFLYQRKQDTQKAITYFSLSSGLIQQKKRPSSDEKRTTLFINTGVAYTNLEAFSKAKKYFKQAAKAAENKPVKQAEIYNYLGANYYLGGNNTQALTEIEKAISIAQPKRAWNVLLTSYDLLSRIHQAEGSKKRALEYAGKYKKLQRQLQRSKQQKRTNITNNSKLMERQETRIKRLLAEQRQLKELKDVQEKQKKDLALKDNLVQLQKKELALLKKEKELDQSNAQRVLLEKVRQEQVLLINEGKLREANLAKEKTLTALQLERQEAEKKLQEKENQKKMALLQKEKKIQEQKIQRQKEKAKYAIGIIILIVGILGLVLSLLLITNKNRRRLKKQKNQIEEKNAEIVSQNEELYQQQEEIMTQRDNIEEKNQLLHRQHHHIQQSIKAALAIQESILPDHYKISALLPENFILYRPKDVVSGDFYWLEKIGQKTALAAVDCTGHGVPGAFMSVIGNNLLNHIIQVQKLTEPQDILAALNVGIEKSLRQKEKGYKNGMDLALIVWEDNNTAINLTFAGAKRCVYYFKKGQKTLHKINASRYSVGIENPTFEQESFVLEKGDTLYLNSDGYIDQNNIKRKKVGTKKFEKLLSDAQDLSIPEQKKLLDQTLNDHMKGVEQRDDILVIGLKF